MRKFQLKISIIDYYKKEKKLLFYFLISSFIVAALDLYGPIIVQRLIDISIPNKNINYFIYYSSILLVIYIVRFILSLYSGFKGQLMGNKIKFLMREDLYNKILSQHDEFFREHQSGDIISRVINDLENVSSLLYRGLEDFIFSILSILGATILMLNFNVKLTVITMLPLPVAIVFTIYQNKKLKMGYGEIRSEISRLTSVVFENLKTIFFIKNNLLEEEVLKEFKENNEKLLRKERKNIFNTSSLMSGINFYNQLTQLIVIFMGGYLHIKGEISLGIIISFILLTNRFRIYLLKLMGLIDTYQRGMTGIERFQEIMSLKESFREEEELDKEIESIEIKNLNFSYDNKKILKNISIQINRGDKVAFVGTSGVGKTTIFSLLKKSIFPEEEMIYINNRCINKLERKSILKRIGILDQNENMLDRSILNNIKIVKKNASSNEIEKVVESACISDLSHRLEEKINLSSGQKQRVAIARLFLKKPDVLLLDEGTSALDNRLEKNIMENILKEFKDKIVISIAHRLQSIKDFNKIIVLGKEGIVETGSFEELIEKKGEFYRMYNYK